MMLLQRGLMIVGLAALLVAIAAECRRMFP